jgi:aminopeptidase N
MHLLRATQRAGAPIDGFTLAGATDHYPPDLGLEPRHLRLEASVDLDTRSLDAVATWTLRANRPGEHNLVLDAVGFERCTVDGPGVTARYDGQKLYVRFAEAIAPGTEHALRVVYRVANPIAGLYFSAPDADEPSRPLFVSTDNETERARYWLPCIDQPAVRTSIEFHLRARAELTALANGELVAEETHEDGSKTTIWRLAQPCPSYLACFVVGDLVRADDRNAAGVPIAYFTTREFTEAHLRRSFGRTPEMLDWITQRLGVPYPYPKYFQYALPDIGGAMENISLVSWDDRFVLDDTLALEWKRLVDQINVHEMAHTWFGDAVVCRDFAHAWLKESWATYIEYVWFEECVSRDDADLTFHDDAEAYFGEADGRYRRPLVTRTFNSSWQMYDMHLYPGGACRLHTLRGELGDDVFWEGVRRYLRRYVGQVVETDHFRHVMEEVSGRSLGRFFDQWIHSAGYPDLKITWAWDAARHEGTFTIEQSQVEAKTGGVFDLQLDLGWVIDGALHTRRVKLDQIRHQFVVSMGSAPTQVRVDPFSRTLHKQSFNPGDDLLLEQLTKSPDIIGRIRAARELAKTGRRKNIDAIATAYRTEPFWGVRMWFARALRDAGTQQAVAHLAHLLDFEQDPRVLEPLIRAAGAFRDPLIRDAIEQRVVRGLPYRAAGAAYEALGSQRSQAPVDLLLDAANIRTFSGFAQQGALTALAATHQRTATDAIARLARHGQLPERVRPAAVRALGEAARFADKHSVRVALVEQLVDLLRDPMLRVQQAAVAGLATAADGRGIGALERYAAGLPPQEAVAVRRAVADIRKAEEAAGRGDERVDKLDARVRALQQALDTIQARLDPVSADEPKPDKRDKKKKK